MEKREPSKAPGTYAEIKLGDYYERSVEITGELIKSFAELTGDFNPIHLDPDYAAKSFFKKRIAHGLLPVSFIGAIFGTALPGPGSIYLNQSVVFTAPVFLGDTITVRAEVVGLDHHYPKVTLKTTIKNQLGKTVVDGSGEILFEPMKPDK
ncbi:MAG: MaoC family dehydratase [Deltaproteobacteria bacterium]|jgi:3-hydroxybutyryl-CoA dehydratase|nr:MaoC family dehydratase [Deltaproteobacteria bacterium]